MKDEEEGGIKSNTLVFLLEAWAGEGASRWAVQLLPPWLCFLNAGEDLDWLH